MKTILSLIAALALVGCGHKQYVMEKSEDGQYRVVDLDTGQTLELTRDHDYACKQLDWWNNPPALDAQQEIAGMTAEAKKHKWMRVECKK